ncbi:MAG: hypothetical protein JXA10_17890 [Anaerolineae bacterium]|nr:hypothetical protein [Anaerolineae bacterium]
MQLKCPVCGAPILAGQINVQELVAVCPACDHVFAFNRETVARKAKARKLKTPARVQARQDDHQLTLAYVRASGAGPKLSLVTTTVCSLMALGAGSDGAPHGIVMIFAALALLALYTFAVFMTTTTRITADEDSLTVSSGPLPFPIKNDKTLKVETIAQVAFEEAQESFPSSLGASVYAELHNGERVNVVTALPHEHARYLAATLDDYLRAAAGAVYEGEEDVLDDDVLNLDEAQWTGEQADGEIDEAGWSSSASEVQRKSAG